MSLFLSFDIQVSVFSVHGVKLQGYYRPLILFDTAVLSLLAFISYRFCISYGILLLSDVCTRKTKQKKKRIVHVQSIEIFEFLPPQKCILPP